jgi:spore germination cell wall hydrolase CwlJ-like protein
MDNANALLRRFILALVVYREASNQSAKGKLLVAQVIENRVQDKRWPDTYVSVITQRLQFSSFNPNDINNSRWPKENEAAWAECVEAADNVMATAEPFTMANHYHTKAVAPAWANPAKITETEGDHIFYQL